jgi:hypothetical protein
MIDRNETQCPCGHDHSLHDGYGCIAFLGAFAPTAHLKRRCPCKQTANRLSLLAKNRPAPPVVAEVQIRERRGSAIGVCEFPPALELAASGERVLDAIKRRLRQLIAAPADGSPQGIRVVEAGDRESGVWIERLR